MAFTSLLSRRGTEPTLVASFPPFQQYGVTGGKVPVRPVLDCADEDDAECHEDWATLLEHTPSEPEKAWRGGWPFQTDFGLWRTPIACTTARILWNLTVSSFVAFPSWQSLFRRGTGPDCAVVWVL